MADVIYAGSSSRPALGRAEVTLTIDNSSGRLPLDMAEVTITRTLFRSGESEYAINGAPCRLLDIQELLSDTGVGRQQHMIIGQGQLDTVLNARPEDRRAIVEDAAGVRKHRQRRERAERRLAATQENLERLGDLVREVRRQIRPLERQATAARSHAGLAAELSVLRQHLAGVELAELADRGRTTGAALDALRDEERELGLTLAELDRAASAAAAELASRREEDLAAGLGRVRALLERTRGTAQVLQERRRSLGVSLDAAADIDVVSTLEAEAARLAAEMAAAESESGAAGPELDGLAHAEAELAADEQAHLAEWGDHRDVAAAEEALEVTRARVEVLRRTGEQARAGLRSLERRIDALGRPRPRARRRRGALDAGRAALAARGKCWRRPPATPRAIVGGAARGAEAAERALGRPPSRSRHRSAARAEALARALQSCRAPGGARCCGATRAWSGRWWSWSRSTPATRRPSRRRSARRWRRWWSRGGGAAKNALGRLRSRGTAGAVLPAPEGADAAGRPDGAARRRRAAAAPRADPPAAGGPLESVLDAVLGLAVVATGGSGPSTWPSTGPTSSWSPPRATGSPGAAGGPGPRRRLVTVDAVEDAEARRCRRRPKPRRPRPRAGAGRGRPRRRSGGLAGGDPAARPAPGRGVGRRRRAEPDRQRPGPAGRRARRRPSDPRSRWPSRRPPRLGCWPTTRGRCPVLEAALVGSGGAGRTGPRSAAGRSRSVGRSSPRRASEPSWRRRGWPSGAGCWPSDWPRSSADSSGHGEEREAAAARGERLEADVAAVDRLAGVVAAAADRLDEVRRRPRRRLPPPDRGGARRAASASRRSTATAPDVERAAGRGARPHPRALDHEAAEVDVRTEALTEMVRQQFGRDRRPR